MIGNDIVDLTHARIESNWKRMGFVSKVFTKQEQRMICLADNSFRCVWRLWSMKEAVYKVIVQQEHRRFFSPKSFGCTIISDTRGEVTYKGQRFSTHSKNHTDYIFTTTNTNVKLWFGQRQTAVQRLQLFANDFQKSVSEVSIRKNAVGVPQVFAHGKEVTSSLSITHHGNFEAIQYQVL